MAKIKFEFSEALKMKAYYFVHLEKLYNRLSGEESIEASFDERLTAIAAIAFDNYLDSRINLYENLVSSLERSNDEKENEAQER